MCSVRGALVICNVGPSAETEGRHCGPVDAPGISGTKTADVGRDFVWCHFFVSFVCFWLTNAVDTRPLRTRIRSLLWALTKNLFIAEVGERRVVGQDEDDAV